MTAPLRLTACVTRPLLALALLSQALPAAGAPLTLPSLPDFGEPAPVTTVAAVEYVYASQNRDPFVGSSAGTP